MTSTSQTIGARALVVVSCLSLMGLVTACSGKTPGYDDALTACAHVSIAGEEVARLGAGENRTWSGQQLADIFANAVSHANAAAAASDDFQQLGLVTRQLERKIDSSDPEFVLDLLSLELECEQLGMYG